MTYRAWMVWLLLAVTGCSGSSTPKNEQVKETKVANTGTPRDKIVDTLHGVEVHDPYRWLEDAASDATQHWVDSQDAVARGWLDDIPEREQLLQRFAELYYIDSVSAPVRRGDRYFWSERDARQEKSVYYWREGDGEKKVLLDPNTMSEDGTASIRRMTTSWDGNTVTYTLTENNADEATLYVLDVASGVRSEIDVIPGAKYAHPSWTPDSKGFYYTRLPVDPDIPVADRPGHAHIRFHALGTDPAQDPIVREPTGDPERFVAVTLSRDGKHLFYFVYFGWNETEVHYQNLEDEDPQWRPLVAGRAHNYMVEAWGDHFYILTDDGATRFRLMRTHASKPEFEHWEELIPEFEDGAVINEAQIIGGHLVLTLMKDVHSELRVYDLNGKLVREVELPGIGATFGMTGNADHDEAYFSFQSFTVPNRIYQTTISNGRTSLWHEIEVPVDPTAFKVEQVWYTSKDGTRVPMFVVTRKDIVLDGSTPFQLYGYGGFSANMHPYFRRSIFPWLEAGGGYAVPNLRGGGEFGEAWHRAGRLHNKQNVFDDFIAAAEYLVDNGYTSPAKLGIAGGSNGGLLVGAAVTQRPDLFGAVVCSVPLLDMVRYHLFGSGKTWISEYGSAEDPKEFETLYAYSPYHRAVPADYPALLMMAADSDDRVDPMHARKFVAAMQYAQQGDAPIMLRLERNAGHTGADLVSQYVSSDADKTAFFMKTLGLSSGAAE